MQLITVCTNLDHTLIHLNEEEHTAPLTAIEDFCFEYNPGEMRERINLMFELSLLDDHYDDSQQRDELFVFSKMLLKAMEAGYLMIQNKPGHQPSTETNPHPIN